MAVYQNVFMERFPLYLHGKKFLIGRIVFVIFGHNIIRVCPGQQGRRHWSIVMLKRGKQGLWLNRCWQWPQQEHVRNADGGEKLAGSPNAFWDGAMVVVSVATGIW